MEENKFQPGDIVRCVRNNGSPNLHIHGLYTVSECWHGAEDGEDWVRLVEPTFAGAVAHPSWFANRFVLAQRNTP